MKYGWTTVKAGCDSDHGLFQAQNFPYFIFKHYIYTCLKNGVNHIHCQLQHCRRLQNKSTLHGNILFFLHSLLEFCYTAVSANIVCKCDI